MPYRRLTLSNDISAPTPFENPLQHLDITVSTDTTTVDNTQEIKGLWLSQTSLTATDHSKTTDQRIGKHTAEPSTHNNTTIQETPPDILFLLKYSNCLPGMAS